MQLFDSTNANGMGACAFDLRAHFVQQGGQVNDFGLARAILQDGLAVGQGCRHQEVFRSRNRNFLKDDAAAFQSVGARFDVAMLLLNLRSQLLETFDVQINRDELRWRNRPAAKRALSSCEPPADQY